MDVLNTKEYKELQNKYNNLEHKYKKLEKEYIETLKKEAEYLKKLFAQNNKCSNCNIDYCKCDVPNFIMDKNNKTICGTCNKRKCKCVKITSFFKI